MKTQSKVQSKTEICRQHSGLSTLKKISQVLLLLQNYHPFGYYPNQIATATHQDRSAYLAMTKDAVSAATILTATGAIAAAMDSTTIPLARVSYFHWTILAALPYFKHTMSVLDCNCDPAGVVEAFAGCVSVPKGELCQCKERVQGRICNQCKPLFWNMQTSNPLGCEGNPDSLF